MHSHHTERDVYVYVGRFTAGNDYIRHFKCLEALLHDFDHVVPIVSCGKEIPASVVLVCVCNVGADISNGNLSIRNIFAAGILNDSRDALRDVGRLTRHQDYCPDFCWAARRVFRETEKDGVRLKVFLARPGRRRRSSASCKLTP